MRIQEENQTLATITLQNYFRLYDKLSGMTGTALTEATEFLKIYKLPVVQIPTNRPMVRADRNDQVYKTQGGQVVGRRARDRRAPRDRPAGPRRHDLRRGLRAALRAAAPPRHRAPVLNARPEYAEREGETIAEAGRPGAVTIATNMAGRGVDIKLGGNPEHRTRVELAKLGLQPGDPDYEEHYLRALPQIEAAIEADRQRVLDAGGLYIIGTERHESRRIDNQLRGRSGRQGDPGESRFFLSAEDDLIRLFAGDRIYKILDRLGTLDVEGNEEPIEAGLLSKQIEKAQSKVEEQHYLAAQAHARVRRRDERAAPRDLRAARPRARGREPLAGARGDRDRARAHRRGVHRRRLRRGLGRRRAARRARPDLPGHARARASSTAAAPRPAAAASSWSPRTRSRQYDAREAELGEELMRALERFLLLQIIDERWREHLHDMDYLREGIHLRGFAQIEPLVAYKNEAFTSSRT